MSTKSVVKSVVQKGMSSNKAFDNANQVAISQDRKDSKKKK
jgi:hypothetical protein